MWFEVFVISLEVFKVVSGTPRGPQGGARVSNKKRGTKIERNCTKCFFRAVIIMKCDIFIIIIII